MIFWKVYFFFMSLIYFLFLRRCLNIPTFSGWVDVFINTITIVALFGLAFDKKIAFKQLWQVGFVLSVTIELFNFIKNYSNSHGCSLASPCAIVWLVLIIPIYIAAFLYAFKSEGIWQESA